MKIVITKHEGKAIGYTMEGETDEEKYAVNTVRNLIFHGFDDTALEYAGRSEGDDKFAGKLNWIQKKHHK